MNSNRVGVFTIFSQPIFLPEGQKDQLGISRQGLNIGEWSLEIFLVGLFSSSDLPIRHAAKLFSILFCTCKWSNQYARNYDTRTAVEMKLAIKIV